MRPRRGGTPVASWHGSSPPPAELPAVRRRCRRSGRDEGDSTPTCIWTLSSAVPTSSLSMGMSSATRNCSKRPAIFSAPKTLNRSSSNERKKRVEPGSPCLPALPAHTVSSHPREGEKPFTHSPLSWLSMRRLSWRLVPDKETIRFVRNISPQSKPLFPSPMT